MASSQERVDEGRVFSFEGSSETSARRISGLSSSERSPTQQLMSNNPRMQELRENSSAHDVRVDVPPPHSESRRATSEDPIFHLIGPVEIRRDPFEGISTPSPLGRSFSDRIHGAVASFTDSSGGDSQNSSKKIGELFSSWWKRRSWERRLSMSSLENPSPTQTRRRRKNKSALQGTTGTMIQKDKNLQKFVNTIQEQYQRATMLPAGAIDKELGEVRQSFKHVTISTTFFSSRPIAAMLSKPLIPLLLFGWMIVLCVDISFGIQHYDADRRSPSEFRGISRLKLIPLELRNGQTEGIQATGLGGLGLTLADEFCPDFGVNFTDNGVAMVDFAAPTDGHSIVLQTGQGEPSEDVAKFEILAQRDGAEWERVAMSGWIQDWDARLVLYPRRIELPLKRGGTRELSMAVSVGWLLGLTGTSIITAAGFIVVVVLASMRYEHLASRVFLLMMGIDSVVLLLAQFWTDHYIYRNYFLVQGVGLGLLTVGLILREALLVYYVTVVGFFYVGWALYEFFFASVALPTSPWFHLSIGLGLLLVMAVILLLRWTTIRASSSLIAEDKDTYDELWDQLREDPAERKGLERVGALAHSMMNTQLDPAPARQLNRKKNRPMPGAEVPIRSVLDWGIQGTVDPRQPVQSLDQLYAQAAGVRPILLHKVQTWCGASGGLVPLPARTPPNNDNGNSNENENVDGDGNQGGSFGLDSIAETRWSHWSNAITRLGSGITRLGSGLINRTGSNSTTRRPNVVEWSSGSGIINRAGSDVFATRHPAELAEDWTRVPSEQLKFVKWRTLQGAECDEVLWAKNKSVSRAIEKTLRSYKGDPSHLLDLCRQSLIFEHVEDLAQCMESIAADPEVVVVRIKNRLRDDYDSTISAGYRDVALNLRVVNEATCGIGVDTHVCELQLILLPFAKMKNAEGHERYVIFRNARGE